MAIFDQTGQTVKHQINAFDDDGPTPHHLINLQTRKVEATLNLTVDEAYARNKAFLAKGLPYRWTGDPS